MSEMFKKMREEAIEVSAKVWQDWLGWNQQTCPDVPVTVIDSGNVATSEK